MRSNKIVLFDFEGTLVDFQWDLAGGFAEAQQAVEQLGFTTADWRAARNYATLWNAAMTAAKERGLSKAEVAECLHAIYDRYDQDALSRWRLLPTVTETLLGLKADQSVRLGLVTNVGRTAIEAACTRLGLAGLFDVIITRNDVEYLKPSSEGIRHAIEQLRRADANENVPAIFVGDSVTDILAAREAHIPVVIIRGGESNREAIASAQPTMMCDAMGELPEAISGIFHPSASGNEEVTSSRADDSQAS